MNDKSENKKTNKFVYALEAHFNPWSWQWEPFFEKNRFKSADLKKCREEKNGKLSIDRAIEKTYWSKSMIKYFPFFAVFLLPSWSSSFLTWLSKLLVELSHLLVANLLAIITGQAACCVLKFTSTLWLGLCHITARPFFGSTFTGKFGLKYYNNSLVIVWLCYHSRR